MTKFTFGHISDLHFSQGSFRDGNHSHSIRHLQGIERVFTSLDLDRVIISGDITDGGDYESLLRAYSWIFETLQIGGDDSTGLQMPPEKVGIVAGNHDAYNKTGGILDPFDYVQKSLVHFNKIFVKHQFADPMLVNYDWIEKDGRAVFLVYVDTSYIGDPEIEKHSKSAYLKPDKIARGKFHKRQSEHILELFQKGVKGRLQYPRSKDCIPSNVFATSLKILTAHHYLFEPKGSKVERLLQLKHARSIFVNLASADFDLYLCGHKHVDDFESSTYGDRLDKRGKGRHLMNLFRRSIGIEALPTQVRDRDGKMLAKAISLLVNVVKKMFEAEMSETESDGKFVEEFVRMLQGALSNPSELEKNISRFLREYHIPVDEILQVDELSQIAQRLKIEFTEEQITQLKQIGMKIEKLARQLSSRPFVQIMAGSAAKSSKNDEKRRSFNVYEIEATDQGYDLNVEKYVWDRSLEEFRVNNSHKRSFHDSHRSIL